MILFSFHSIFRIEKVQQLEDQLWQIHLTLINKDDRQILARQESIREETKQSTGWYKLAKWMVILRDFQHAKEIDHVLLKMAHIYNELAVISDELGQYTVAFQFYFTTHSSFIRNGLQ